MFPPVKCATGLRYAPTHGKPYILGRLSASLKMRKR